MKFYRRSEKGFTLIELLVVVAIISLLSSIVMASLNSSRQKAKNAAITASVKQWINALSLYNSDYGGYYKLGIASYCLGSGPCNKTNGVEGPDIYASAAFRAAMDPYIRGTPNPNTELIGLTPTETYGSAYFSDCSGTNCPTAILWWALYGDSTCGFGATKYVETFNSTTNIYCELSI